MSRARVLLLLLAPLVVIAGGIAVIRQQRTTPAPAVAGPDPDVEGYDETAAENWPRPSFAEHAAPFLARHCRGCHSQERAKGGVVLDAQPGADPALWHRVAVAAQSGRMPPVGRPPPNHAAPALFRPSLADPLHRHRRP